MPLKALQKVKIDIFISEATGGNKFSYKNSHLNLESVHKLIEKLYNQGTLTNNSSVYLTHINHGTSHSQMEECTKQLQFSVPTVVAWDGLKIF